MESGEVEEAGGDREEGKSGEWRALEEGDGGE